MQINSDKSLEQAEKTFQDFKGDWTAVHQAAELENGVLVVRLAPDHPPADDAVLL